MIKFPPTVLSIQDRQALAALTYHAGFKVLQKLMESRVQQATVQMLTVQPDDPDRLKKIADLQAQAFARNSFCAELLEDVNWQLQQDIAESDEPEEAPTALGEALKKTGYIKNEEPNNGNARSTRTN